MRLKYDIQTEKVDATIESFRKDLEIFKSNLIAAGQLTPSYTSGEGTRLASTVQKLQSDFEQYVREANDRTNEVQAEVGNKISTFMTETQSVFDSILTDISSLKKASSAKDYSQEIENLESHLTERISTLTENAMEFNAIQGETLQNLHEKVQEIITRVNEEKKRTKTDLMEMQEITSAKFNGVNE